MENANDKIAFEDCINEKFIHVVGFVDIDAGNVFRSRDATLAIIKYICM